MVPARLADWRDWRAARRPASRYRPVPSVVASPAATMRLRATRARFSLMPNSPVRRTNWATGSSGGSMPSRALAMTERAVSGRPGAPATGP